MRRALPTVRELVSQAWGGPRTCRGGRKGDTRAPGEGDGETGAETAGTGASEAATCRQRRGQRSCRISGSRSLKRAGRAEGGRRRFVSNRRVSWGRR